MVDAKFGQNFQVGACIRMTSGCSKRLSSKAAASEGASRTLRYVEPLSDARTPLADFFSIQLVSPLEEWSATERKQVDTST